MAVDNSNQEPNITCIPKSGTRLPIGQTYVNCIAQDKSGNMARCNFAVDIQGNQLRVLIWLIFIILGKLKVKTLYVVNENVLFLCAILAKWLKGFLNVL